MGNKTKTNKSRYLDGLLMILFIITNLIIIVNLDPFSGFPVDSFVYKVYQSSGIRIYGWFLFPLTLLYVVLKKIFLRLYEKLTLSLP